MVTSEQDIKLIFLILHMTKKNNITMDLTEYYGEFVDVKEHYLPWTINEGFATSVTFGSQLSKIKLIDERKITAIDDFFPRIIRHD